MGKMITTPYLCPRHGLECVRVIYSITVRKKDREYERFECPLVAKHQCSFIKPNKWKGYREMKLKIAVLALLVFGVVQSRAQAASGFTKLATVNTNTYTDSTCANQTTCYYQVTAVDSLGHESPATLCGSSQLCFGTNQAVVTMPSSGTHTVSLSWTASTTTGVQYNVYRAVGPLSASNLSATVN